jgi:hypothetical protein
MNYSSTSCEKKFSCNTQRKTTVFRVGLVHAPWVIQENAPYHMPLLVHVCFSTSTFGLVNSFRNLFCHDTNFTQTKLYVQNPTPATRSIISIIAVSKCQVGVITMIPSYNISIDAA